MKTDRCRGWVITPSWAGVLVVLVLAILVVGTAAASGALVIVTLTDKPAKFVPEKVTIKVGDTVEWRNTGRLVHAVKISPPIPSGAHLFDSGVMRAGAAYRYTFAVPGTYHYVCLPHFGSGMVGEVIVTK
jgi:plastocyanin